MKRNVSGSAPKAEEKFTGFLFQVIILFCSVWVCLLLLRAGPDWTIGVVSPGFTRPAVYARTRFHRHVLNVFRSLPCFLCKTTCPHIDVCSKKCSPTVTAVNSAPQHQHVSLSRPLQNARESSTEPHNFATILIRNDIDGPFYVAPTDLLNHPDNHHYDTSDDMIPGTHKSMYKNI